MNSLLEACGATSPWELAVETSGAPLPESSPFDQPFLVIGQDAGTDLRLVHKDVSARHAFLQWIGGRVHVLDLGSRTGVLYEGRRQRTGWLDPGQTVRIGPYRIAVAAGPDTRTTNEAGVLPALALDIKLRGIRSVTARAEGHLAILGSAADCEVRLLDPAITNYHCAVVNTPRGSWIVDLLGAGGITVNGASVRWARLAEGDTIAVGRSTVRVARIEWPQDAPGEETPPPQKAAADPPNIVEPAATLPDARATREETPPPAPEQYAQPLPRAQPEPLDVPSQPDAEPDRAPEPRMLGFFSPWRRTPVPNRAAAAPAPVEARSEELPPTSTPAPVWRSEPAAETTAWEEPSPPSMPRDEPTYSRSAWSSPPPYDPAPASPQGSERRGSCRYPVAARKAQISWWETAATQPAGRLGQGGGGTAVSTRAQSLRGGASAVASRDNETSSKEGPQNRTVAVSMVDVSHAGLAVLSPIVPPRGERVWFRLDNEQAVDWVELSAVGAAPGGGGQHIVRFAFRETCPYDLFKILVFSGPPRP
ncbi:MAG: FHA domain-containing protein [Isosphaeraceae bacterium]|nr:FHA domain-containing protein [Isosphaeraceae bacterium]